MASPEASTQTLTPYQETGRQIFYAMGLQSPQQHDLYAHHFDVPKAEPCFDEVSTGREQLPFGD